MKDLLSQKVEIFTIILAVKMRQIKKSHTLTFLVQGCKRAPNIPKFGLNPIYSKVPFNGYVINSFLSLQDYHNRSSTGLKLPSQCLELLNKGHIKFSPTFTSTSIVLKSFQWDKIKCDIIKLEGTGHSQMCDTAMYQ